MLRLALALYLPFVLAACGARAEPASASSPDFEPPSADGFGRAAELVYFEEVIGVASAAEALPMVVLLHGRGDRPRANYLPLKLPRPVRVIMPRAPTPFGDGYSWFAYRANGESAERLARALDAEATQVATALAVLRERRPTLGLPIVGGFSQGGMLTYALALRHPNLMQLALPLGGLLPEPLWPRDALGPGSRAPKIRAAHGTSDTTVPFSSARATADALSKRGYDIALLEEDGVAHAISPRMVAMLNRELSAALDAMPRDSAEPVPVVKRPLPRLRHDLRTLDLLREQVVVHLFDVPLADAQIAFVPLHYERPLSDALDEHDLVINGGYWAYAKDARVIQGLLIVNDEQFSAQHKSGGVLEIRDGNARMFRSRKYRASKGTALAIQCHPRLVDDAKVITALDTKRVAARTALCVTKQRRQLRVYMTEARITLAELGDFLVGEGCEQALNLDGGPSTSAVARLPEGVFKLGLGQALPYGIGFRLAR